MEKNDSGDWCRHSLSLCGEELRLCQSACERSSTVPKPQQRWQQSILAAFWGFHFHFIQELLALVRMRNEKQNTIPEVRVTESQSKGEQGLRLFI